MNRISYNLEGTTTVITGWSSGIGLATAALVAKSGGHVIVSESRQPEKTARALELIRSVRSNQDTDVMAFPYEASNEDSVRQFFEAIKNTGKRVDYLMHSAGISPDREYDKQDSELWNRVMATNVTGTAMTTKYARNLMKEQEIIDGVRGKILLVTSTNGIDSYGIFSDPYDASKAANNVMVRNEGEHFHREDNIIMNGIAPGWIETALNDSLAPEDRKAEEAKLWSWRFATPQELAMNAIAMLLLPYKSGRVDMVDGGYR